MSKPEITATIKFRGVTIEGMTIDELRQLRDLLNDMVGPKVIGRVVERREYVTYPWPTWVVTSDSTALGPQPYSDSLNQSSSGIVITCVN